jgi:restriction system protein
MKAYYRVMPGKKSAFAAECFAGGFIGADFEIAQDLSKQLPEEYRMFPSIATKSASSW